ncbi:hypothetical protein Y032_0051g2133 [Ancylostoma ceylanicum]|uniref:Uncharacterized protein n=1 Tax=Ancylostoma ceylanicum TaxID=53326 RepID=A0A016U8P6_9BILA|nr:hypothetical protein Y032_0051g2133 [Ancylostoma ceylanicum]
MSRSLLGYIFRLLLAKLKPAGIRRSLWQRRSIHLYRSASEEQGAAFVNPATCLTKGLVEHQIVEVSVTYQTWQKVIKRTSRLMRLRLSQSIPADFLEIGRSDAYNMFGCEPGRDFVVDSLKSYHMAPRLHATLDSADTVRLAPVKQYDIEPKDDFSGELKELLQIPQ